MTGARAALGLGLLMLAAACGSGSSSCPPPSSSCADLRLYGHGYVAWRTLTPPAGAPNTLQEVGDATYPACNVCDDPFHGLQSTDVWHLPGAGFGQAVLGYRQGTTDVFVVYVRQGVDPASLHLRNWAAR
jgi:hypothetical protein